MYIMDTLVESDLLVKYVHLVESVHLVEYAPLVESDLLVEYVPLVEEVIELPEVGKKRKRDD